MKRSKRIFSWSIFLASFKCNYISYLVVTFGNALILFILVLILSSLTINATRQSMSNLFNSANMERQMKEGAVSLYLSYDEGIQLYNDEMPLLGEYSPLLYESFVTIMELNTGEYDLALNTIKITYDGLYSSPLNNGETIEEKHAYAISETINLVNTFIPLFNLDDSINDFLPYFISDFLDEYSLNSEMSNKELIKGSIKNSIDDYLKNKFDFENENIELINESIDKLLVVENKDEFSAVALNEVDVVVDTLGNNVVNYFTIDIPTNIIIEAYLSNKDAYQENTILDGNIGYKDNVYIEVIATLMGTLFEENYYLEALPEFTVNYLTNERGIPYYVKDGKEVLVLNISDRDKLVKVKEGMGKKANLLEKQYKEILTGEPYSESEINIAKVESKEFYDIGYKFVYDFLKEYINNKSLYYNEETNVINDDAVIKKVANDLKIYAEPIINNLFGVNSIEELTEDKYGIDGKEILSKVYDYAFSSISVYKTEYDICKVDKGYDEKTSILVSLVKASDTLVDQIPDDIYIKLYDLSSRNLYGLVIGSMFFSMAGLLLPMVYSILTSNSLVASEVENGSLAFTLSSPLSRTSIILTKAIYQIVSITTMFIVLLIFGLIARELAILIGGDDFISSFSVLGLTLYSLGAYLVILAISGICFLCSTVFNKTKYSLGVGGGISIFFLVTSILGLFGLDVMPLALRIDTMNIFNYLTIIRLFDVQAIMDGNVIFYYKIIGLILIAFITYSSSIVIFNKKDLPL